MKLVHNPSGPLVVHARGVAGAPARLLIVLAAALCPGAARAAPVAPEASWKVLLEERFDGEASLHPSWKFFGGWPGLAREGQTTYLVVWTAPRRPDCRGPRPPCRRG
jgi:hypothetical protein